MDHLSKSFRAHTGDIVKVDLTSQANVLLMDATNYSRYKRGQSYRYQGGWRDHTPVRLSVPHNGAWVVAVDLGGAAGRIGASVAVISGTYERI